jgi:ferredoxin-thioredoxin reductase catalytic subunit
MAVDMEAFGIANFKLARKVMKSGNCQCVPKDPCPCEEWTNNGKCHCNVFWNLEERELSKTQVKIIKLIISKLEEKLKEYK